LIPEILISTDYWQEYRFGFNGMEKDPEITGQEGSHYTATFWEYDTRIARRWNVDPLIADFPWQSPYLTFDGNPTNKIDPTGEAADWVKNIETKEYEWHDDVTSANETPEGYSYIGKHDNDILKDLNLPLEYNNEQLNRVSAGLDGDGKTGIPIGSKTSVSVHLSIKPIVSYNLTCIIHRKIKRICICQYTNILKPKNN